MQVGYAYLLSRVLVTRAIAEAIGDRSTVRECADQLREAAAKLIGAGITVSPSPTEANAPAPLVAQPVGAGRGEGTFVRNAKGKSYRVVPAGRLVQMPFWPDGQQRLDHAGVQQQAGDHNAHVVRWVFS